MCIKWKSLGPREAGGGGVHSLNTDIGVRKGTLSSASGR